MGGGGFRAGFAARPGRTLPRPWGLVWKPSSAATLEAWRLRWGARVFSARGHDRGVPLQRAYQ